MKVRGVMCVRPQHSDAGESSLAELKQQLFGHGLSFCCVIATAANMNAEKAAAFVAQCHRLSDQAFVFIPGFEIMHKDTPLLLIGTDVFLASGVDENTWEQWRAVTPLVYVARDTTPSYEKLTMLLPQLDGIEVWDQGRDGSAAPHFKTLNMLTHFQTRQPELKAIGGIGETDYRRGGPVLELEVDTVDRGAIVRQLTLGFYVITNGSVVLTADGIFQRGGGLLTRCRGAIGRLAQSFRSSTGGLLK